MKTLLRGGPLDGKVIETRRNDFGFAESVEKWKKTEAGDRLVSREEAYYEGHHLPDETHPCKKRGKVRVFQYRPEGRGRSVTQ